MRSTPSWLETLENRVLLSAAPGFDDIPVGDEATTSDVVANRQTLVSATPDSGDTRQDARNLGAFSGNLTRVHNEHVGGVFDDNDWFKFRVDAAGAFTITLTGLSADIDLTLNQFGSGAQLASSIAAGNSNESITRTLQPGWYAISVDPYAFLDSDYVLTVKSGTGGVPEQSGDPTDAGGSQATAAALGVFNVPKVKQAVQDLGDGSDSADWYKFRVDQPMYFVLTLNDLNDDLDLSLHRNNGVKIVESRKSGTQVDRVARWLNPGWYAVRITPFQTAESSYRLRVAASIPDTAPTRAADPATLASADAAWRQRVQAHADDEVEVESVLDLAAPVLPALA